MTFLLGTERQDDSLFRRSKRIDLTTLGAIHVIGSPGEGKSTFLGRLADACVEVGEGVLLIDPKGDLAVEVARRTTFADRLIYVAPGAYPQRAFTLNVLEVDQRHPRRRQLQEIAASNLVTMFEHLGRYDPGFMTLVGKYLNAAVQTVFTQPQPTLRDVIILLLDEQYRATLTDKTRRPDIKWFWDDYEDWNNRDQRVQVDSTKGRLWDFLLSSVTSSFIASPTSTLRLADWLDQGKLVVVNLAEGLPEEDTERLGNLIVAYLTTIYRLRESNLAPWSRERRWRLIVDEFHELSPAPFARIIRNGRAFNFFPVVAHQDMAQLNDYPHLKGAIGHAARLAFRRSSADIPPTSYEDQRQYVAAQAALHQYEADWTARSPTGTTTTRVRLADWKSAAKVEQFAAAVDQARDFTLPRSEIPSLWERYEAWRRGGEKKPDGHTKPTPKPARSHPVERASTNLPDAPDPAGVGSAQARRPAGLLDLIPGGQAALLGAADHQGTPSEPPRRAEGGQRNVPAPPQGPPPARSRAGGGVPDADQTGAPRVEPADPPRRRPAQETR